MKKIAALLAVLLLFSLLPLPVWAAPASVTADMRTGQTSCEVGDTLTYTIRTPRSVTALELVYGTFSADAQLSKTGRTQKLWTCEMQMNTAGTLRVKARAYAGETPLTTYLKRPVDIQVIQPLTHTLDPILQDSRMAVFLADLTLPKGAVIQQSGFYYGTSKDDLRSFAVSNSPIRNRLNKLVTGLTPNTQYYYRAYVKTNKGSYKSDIVSFTTLPVQTYPAEACIFADPNERYNYLFGTGGEQVYTMSEPPYGFANGTEASAHFVTVKVPVWKLVDGKKVSSTWSFKINSKLAANVLSIFQDLYTLQFPLADITSYTRFRNLGGAGVPKNDVVSHHSYGAALDINRYVNDLYVGGDYRDPTSPFYITRAVIDVFEKHGWDWGGNFAEFYDTMHFQYLGKRLMS